MERRKRMATLNPNLADFWFVNGIPTPGHFIKARNRVLYGGRASSKSWEFAGMAAGIGAQYQTKFLCVRRYQNRIKESVYTIIADQIGRFELPGFEIRANDIKHANGTQYVFYGIERNIDEIKSFEGADVLWIEEAHNLTEEQWKILDITIRKANSEVWISFNSRLISDFVYQRFIINPPPDTIVRLVNYVDNPFLSETARKIIEHEKSEDYESYLHVYMGVPRSEDNDSVIKISWIEAAIDAHLTLGIPMGGARSVGYDVADSGDDKNAVIVFDGAVCVGSDEWKAPEDELSSSAMRAWSFVNFGTLIYDSVGVGAHVGSTLNANGHTAHVKFNAGGAVVNPRSEYKSGIKNEEKFENVKAQAWQDVADRFRNTYNAVNKGHKYNPSELISISSLTPNIERLKSELCVPRKSISKRGLDMVEQKESIIKRGIKSPNLADAFIMAACPHLMKRKTAGVL